MGRQNTLEFSHSNTYQLDFQSLIYLFIYRYIYNVYFWRGIVNIEVFRRTQRVKFFLLTPAYLGHIKKDKKRRKKKQKREVKREK